MIWRHQIEALRGSSAMKEAGRIHRKPEEIARRLRIRGNRVHA